MSINRIRGDGGVIIDSKSFLELPKAPTKQTSDIIRSGMLRYNQEWKSFEGVLDFSDGTAAYRRFANLDENGKLLTSQLPDSITSGLQFMGTYDPISDDIDPPNDYEALPAPEESLKGDYFIVRGIMDAAQAHYDINQPTTSPVTFVPVNPEGSGNWIEILYYIDRNPIEPTIKIVTSAFARILVSAIPSTGHAGLINLAQDETITNPFDTSATPQNQTALTDGDWVIITETQNIRLRQNRTSITASSVLYDNTLMVASKRKFHTNAGTVQTTLDNVIIECLRRTGDSMMDDGSGAGGRLGIMYGSATAPSLSFNNMTYDPAADTGNVPSAWTDGNTGIFHPGTAMIGFSTAGVERVRITNNTLTLFQTSSNVVSAPILRFDSASNTNVGISGVGNIISFSAMDKTQVEFRNGSSLFHGDITVDGASTLTGVVNTGSDLNVTGNTNLKSNLIVGTSSTNTMTVNATSTFASDSTFNGTNNKFKNINLFDGGTFTFESPTNSSNIKLVGADMRINMGNFADLTVYDNGVIRTRINRYGIQLPVLAVVDDSLGVDGMVAYSPTNKTSLQKVEGKWVPIGSGTVRENVFAIGDWVLSGSYYTLTVSASNIVVGEIQEQVSAGVYAKVEVDSVTYNGSTVVFSIPSTPDVRFAGRTLVTIK